MKNILNKLVLLLLIIISINAKNIYAKDSYDYVINNYIVDISVLENNTFDISEVLTVQYNAPKHGIIRILPIQNTVMRLDGTSSRNNARITNVSVNAPYNTSKEDGKYYIKIGSQNETATGTKTYKINYTYNIGKDCNPTYDEFYFNIIGNHWDVPIKHVSFNITMPKSFDANKLGFSYGGYGSTSNENIHYTITRNTISGQLNSILDSHSALTVRLELPEGYFVGAGFPLDFWSVFMCTLPIVFLVICVYFYYRWGNLDEIIETVEFYPPNGHNSLDVGFLYKGGASEKHVTSLLIYLANKGYLSIQELQTKSFLSKHNNFIITKLKDYDGTNPNEKLFFDGLFKDSSSVTYNDLYDSFYVTMNKILSKVNAKENKHKIFDKDSFGKIKYMLLMILALVGLINLPMITILGNFTNFAVGSVIIGIFVLFILAFALDNINSAFFSSSSTESTTKISPILKTLILLILGLVFSGIHLAFLLKVLDNIYYICGYALCFLSILGILFILKYFPQRTSFGKDMLGKVRGFKNFLETCEKDKLEAMVMENPMYFYDILPFTYVLDVSDKWINKFEGINMQSPSWYHSNNAFDVIYFNNFMNNTLNSVNYAMSASKPSNTGSSGISSSGGGFAGGGSGGGGGRSW